MRTLMVDRTRLGHAFSWRVALCSGFGFLVLFAASGATLVAGDDDEKEWSEEERRAEEARLAELRKLPNLVLVIADDMSWDDCSAYGHPSIRTPNIQRLADEGMRFDNAYLTISSCSPSRASILTGRYPHNTDAEELHWPLPAEQVTFAEKLKEKGYWTAAAGKWHLGEAMVERFDEVREVDTSGFQLPSGEKDEDENGEAGENDAKDEDGEKNEPGKFRETLQGDARSGSADWLPLLKDRPRDRPFFLWLAALDPHRPYHDNILEEGARQEDIRVPPYHPDTPSVREDYRLYYDEIMRFDRYLGRVLDELEEQGVAENTAVLLISDNGRPFPRDKTTLYDSGIKTPWILRWPERVEPGSVCPRLVSSLDIAPTLMKFAGIEDPGPSFRGRDLSPLLDDPGQPVREYIFAEKNWHDFEDHARAVRNERYKYIRNAYNDLPLTPPADAVRSPTYVELLRLREKGELLPHQLACFVAPRPAEELYDTRLDPHELNNLAGDERYSSLLSAMREALDNWEQLTGDEVPELRTADEFDRITGQPTDARVRPRLSKKEMVKKGLAAP